MMNAIVLGGENTIYIKQELDKIIESSKDNSFIYYGDEFDQDVFFSDLMTEALFFDKRILIIKNAEKIKAYFEKKILEYLKNPLDSVCLVLEYKKIPSKILDAILSLGDERGIVHNFKKPFLQDLKKYAIQKLGNKGIEAGSSVIDLLISFSGEDIEELSGMLDRLILCIGEEKKMILEEEVRIILERAQNASIFDLIDAIFSHNISRALECLSDLCASGQSFPSINAMFYRATKIMWAVKTAKNGQIPLDFSISNYEWKKYQSFASKNNLRFLSDCFECISEIEITSKRLPESVSQLVFEKFLCAL